MTTRLDEIKERWKWLMSDLANPDVFSPYALRDIAYCLARIEKLEAALETLAEPIPFDGLTEHECKSSIRYSESIAREALAELEKE